MQGMRKIKKKKGISYTNLKYLNFKHFHIENLSIKSVILHNLIKKIEIYKMKARHYYLFKCL